MEKPVARSQEPVVGRHRSAWLFLFLLSTGFWLLASSPADATPSQQDVFKSIHDSVDEKSDFDSRPIILLLCGVGSLLVLFVTVNKKRQRGPASKTFNHQGKLVREVMRQVPLDPNELRQLKLLADAAHETELGEIENPLTLLLCPSALGKALQARPAKMDRKTLAQVVRKLNLPSDRAKSPAP